MDHNSIKEALDNTLSLLQTKSLNANALLAQAKGGKKVKRKLSVAFVTAAILILCLATAFALSSGYVLQYLFPRDEAQRKNAEQYVQRVEIIQNSAASSTAIRDALIHDGKLSVGLSVSGDLPIFVVTQSICIDGQTVEVDNSTIENQWAAGNPAAGGKAQPRALGFTVDLSRTAKSGAGIRTVRVVASLLSPVKGVKQVDVQKDDISAVWSEIDAVVAEGMTPVSLYEPYETLVGSEWMLKNRYDKAAGIQYPLGAVKDYLDYANMKLIDRIDVSFDIQSAPQE